MSRILYMHVGPTKTGTSAVQSILRDHDDSVIFYPKIGLYGPGSHHGLVYSFFPTGRADPRAGPDVENLHRALRSCASETHRNVLISSEELLARVGQQHPRGDVVTFVHALTSSLGDSWEVEILFTCREHFERAASAYSQRVKGKQSTEQRDPDAFLLESVNSLLYAPTLCSLADTGFRITVLNYHPSQTWVSRFLAHVGFGKDHIPEAEQKNVSLSTKALIAKLAANSVLQKEKKARQEFAKLLKKMPGYRAPSQFIFGSMAAQEAERWFAPDRRFLRERLNIELPGPELNSKESEFFLDANDLAEISAVAARIGAGAHEIIAFSSRYLRA